MEIVPSNFCIRVPFDPTHRLYNPELGGGALLDLAIYPLSFTTMLFGFPQKISGQAQIGETGVDELCTLTLEYTGMMAQLASGMRMFRPFEAVVTGTEGYIRVHHPFFFPSKVTLAIGEKEKLVELPYKGNGYPHEIEEVHRCVGAGLTESEMMPLDETARMMQLMDGIRTDWGVRYPHE